MMYSRLIPITILAFLSRSAELRSGLHPPNSPAAGFSNQYSVSLDGVNEYIEIADSVTTSDTDSFTVWCWAKVNSTTNGRGLISKTDNPPNRSWVVNGHPANYRLIQSSQSSDGSNINGLTYRSQAPVAGTWFFFAVRYDGSLINDNRIQYAIDSGTFVLATSVTTIPQATLFNTTAPIRIGASIGGSLPSQAQFDECGFARAPLSSACMTEIYNNGNSSIDVRTVSCANQIDAAWHLGDGDTIASFVNYVNPGVDNGVGINLEAGDIVTDHAP